MNNLLNSVIHAHGGNARWSQFSDLITDIDVRGRLCEQQGWRGMVPESRLLVSLREQRTIVLLPYGQGRLVLEPDLLLHLDSAGSSVEVVVNPRDSISYALPGFKWNLLHTAYFMSHVIRHSVTAPFLYAFPGFTTEEVEPWNEDQENWRVLKVTFPPSIEVPSRIQYAYYGPDGMLRRVRNSVALLGGVDLVEYVTSYGEIDGIRIPLARDVYACDPIGRKLDHQHMGHIELRGPFLTD